MARVPLGPILALIVTQFAFASLAVVGKGVLVAGVPPLALAAIRVLFASLLLAALALGLAKAATPISRRDWGVLFGLSVLGVTANQFLFIEGLQRTTAVNATILIVTIPVFTFLVAGLLGRERFEARRAVGVAIALVGTLAMLRAERFEFSDRVALGNLMVVLNCLCYSTYMVLSRDILQRLPSPMIVAWTFLFGAVILVPLGTSDVVAAAKAGAFTTNVWWGLAWIIFVPSVLSYSLNNYALKRVRATTVGSFVFLQPVFGLILAIILLPGEHLDPRAAVAGPIILAGVALVVRAETPRTETVKPIKAANVPADRGRP